MYILCNSKTNKILSFLKRCCKKRDATEKHIRIFRTLRAIKQSCFKGVEFESLLKAAGSNAFTMNPSRWVEFTGAIGIIAYEADLLNVALFGAFDLQWNIFYQGIK
jgi:hypothetical protein